MTQPPSKPKIYHIAHVDNLPSIIKSGGLSSDARFGSAQGNSVNIGMSKIKQRRLQLEVKCHLGTKVGEYVPFYFSTRSVMLYIISCRNHPELTYTGGQIPIVHLEADFYNAIQWAASKDRLWAFTKSNAGASYTKFFCDPLQLNEIDWSAVAATDFRTHEIKEAKQAEFLLYGFCPWELFDRIGVINQTMAAKTQQLIRNARRKPDVIIERGWYY